MYQFYLFIFCRWNWCRPLLRFLQLVRNQHRSKRVNDVKMVSFWLQATININGVHLYRLGKSTYCFCECIYEDKVISYTVCTKIMIDASTEQDVKAGDGSLKGEVPCATVCIKVQLSDGALESFVILSKQKIYLSRCLWQLNISKKQWNKPFRLFING